MDNNIKNIDIYKICIDDYINIIPENYWGIQFNRIFPCDKFSLVKPHVFYIKYLIKHTTCEYIKLCIHIFTESNKIIDIYL